MSTRTVRLGPSFFVRFSRDGTWLASCGERSVHVRRAGVSKPAFTGRLSNPSGGDFSPDSRFLLLKTTAGSLHVLGPLDGEVHLALIDEGRGEGADPIYTAGGQLIVDGSWSGRLAVLDAATRTPLRHREFPADMLTDLATADTGDSCLVRHSPRGTTATEPPGPDYFSAWPLPLAEQPLRLVRPGLRFVPHSALSASGALLALNHGAPPEHVSIVDAATGDILGDTRIDPGGTGGRLAWAPTGELAVVDRHRVLILSSRLELLVSVDVEYACDVAFSPMGDLLAIGSWSSGLLLSTRELFG